MFYIIKENEFTVCRLTFINGVINGHRAVKNN